MIISKLKELESLKAKAATLEKQVTIQLTQELASLPSEYGFDSTEAFISAVRAAAGGRKGRKAVGRPIKAAAKPASRRKRATITDETRVQVKQLVGEGKTGGEIAKAVGISLPSVQNIKKALGLVSERKKK